MRGMPPVILDRVSLVSPSSKRLGCCKLDSTRYRLLLQTLATGILSLSLGANFVPLTGHITFDLVTICARQSAVKLMSSCWRLSHLLLSVPRRATTTIVISIVCEPWQPNLFDNSRDNYHRHHLTRPVSQSRRHVLGSLVVAIDSESVHAPESLCLFGPSFILLSWLSLALASLACCAILANLICTPLWPGRSRPGWSSILVCPAATAASLGQQVALNCRAIVLKGAIGARRTIEKEARLKRSTGCWCCVSSRVESIEGKTDGEGAAILARL